MKPDFTKADGLIPAIIQDILTKEVLMQGFMNDDAYQKTLQTKLVHFWSRSRKKLWQKGETSGNLLKVKRIFLDCDQDSLLIEVEVLGHAVCHTGERSCFFTEVTDDR